jgi:Tol biopolymer transport system component
VNGRARRRSADGGGGTARRAAARRGAVATLATLALGVSGAVLGCDVPWRGPGGGTTRLPAADLTFSSENDIFTVGTDGAQRRRLTRSAGGGWARDPVWAPDGARIAYAYSPPPTPRGPGDAGAGPVLPATEIWVVDAAGGGARALVPHSRPGVAYETPVWAPDGAAIYGTYTELIVREGRVVDSVVGVVRVPLGGARPEPQLVVSGGGSPTISPDGTRLVYVAGRLSLAPALYLAEADGARPRPLLPPDLLTGVAAPRFSPDGRRIAFAAVVPESVAPAPAAPPTPAPTPAANAGAARPGRALAAVGHGAGALRPRPVAAHGLPMDVFVVGADGGDLRRLTHLRADDPAPAWSPAGDRLAVLAADGIYLIKVAGGEVELLARPGGQGTIDWRPASPAPS